MIPDILIIIGYFVTLMVPVATVVTFFKLDADPETSRLLPEMDSYYMPEEETPRQLPPASDYDEIPTLPGD